MASNDGESLHVGNDRAEQVVKQMKQFGLAAQPEIMRAAEKDDQYASYVYEACHESVRQVFGTRYAVAFQNETKLVGQILYFLITTGTGLQTLGEEYCDLIQIGRSSGLSPTPAQRISLVFLETALPYIAERLSARIAARGLLLAHQNQEESAAALTAGRSHNDSAFGAQLNSSENPSNTFSLRETLKKLFSSAVQKWPLVLPHVQEATQLLVRANLMFFYFEAKRVAGIRFSFIGRQIQQRPRYQIIGLFLLVQLLIIGVDRIRHSNFSAVASAVRSYSVGSDLITTGRGILLLNEDGNPVTDARGKVEGRPFVSEMVSSSKCSLCLSPRQYPTATPCGHVFCWECIAGWCNEKPECPLCRSPVAHSNLVCLYHSDF